VVPTGVDAQLADVVPFDEKIDKCSGGVIVPADRESP
jgi:hypothetical protein